MLFSSSTWREAYVVTIVIALSFGHGARAQVASTAPPATATAPPASVRITMEALHQAGGVPPGWEMSLGDGDARVGRIVFVELGCHLCHHISGAGLPEPEPAARAPGPDLAGMGSHHPPAYFAESIINPDAVIIEGPGYTGEDGRSIMPAYPDATLGQLRDVVAYLSSLTGGAAHQSAGLPPIDQSGPRKPLPAHAPRAATAFLAQIYDINEGQLAAFEDWFRREGAPRLTGHSGLVSIETFVDRTRRGPSVITVFGFTDEAARRLFSTHGAVRDVKLKFDEFAGRHGHYAFDAPPLYRAMSLSAPQSASAPPHCATQCDTCHAVSFASCDPAYHRMESAGVGTTSAAE